jgi:hypothetical protein
MEVLSVDHWQISWRMDVSGNKEFCYASRFAQASESGGVSVWNLDRFPLSLWQIPSLRVNLSGV